MFPERRGNLFSDEIYRLVKAKDATTNIENEKGQQNLPPNNKFSKNDVILLTLQPLGSGDFFDPKNLPTNNSAQRIEARVINRGPTYIDVAVNGGIFEATFGPAPNNDGPSGRGDSKMRLRVDRFFSDIPYNRMVEAITRISSIPERESQQLSEGMDKDQKEGKHDQKKKSNDSTKKNDSTTSGSPHSNICMDDLLRELIISSHAFTDPSSPMFHDVDAVDLVSIERRLARPPMPSSEKLANQVLKYIQSNRGTDKAFKPLNAPQLAAIGAALTRKLTLIQGPPGTGKTTTASVIGFGFTHQCRSLSPNAKVLASAFSNAGADNLAESFLLLGLKVVRIGKASAVSESLWDYTLDAAIDSDPDAKKAMDFAASATAQLMKIRKDKTNKKSSGVTMTERAAQESATAAVKRSIKASNIAATKALREADIIVSTCTGAADPRLMAACGLDIESDQMLEENNQKGRRKTVKGQGTSDSQTRTISPDGLPPLSLPFVIVDEACQSVEPGTLIPLTASNSCRSLVLLGDPCQLPATTRSEPGSSFSVSLMERLAATLPAPKIKMKDEDTEIDTVFADSLPVKQARSFLRSQSQDDGNVTYRKRFAGCLLLSLQYRMHPSIAAFSSAMFYDGLLASPSFVANERPFPAVLNEIMPCRNPSVGVRMVNVGGRCNEMKGESTKYTETVYSSNVESTTYRNEAEAVRVVTIIKGMLEFDHKYNPDDAKKIGVISPYNGQVHLIKSLLADDEDIISLVRSTSATIEVNSVDGYQGRERDVIIFSAVRSNHQGNIGFLTDWRRLNVALTRAKLALLVVGDMDTLAEGDKYWGAFSKWCEGNRCLVDDIEECNLF
jgi:superfamily I DNA and/or RNA helicase